MPLTPYQALRLMINEKRLSIPVLNHARWLFVLAAVLILTGIGLRDPWPADEPRFALIAQEMAESGQWLFPLRAGELYPDKPPVFMWFMAFFISILGSVKLAFLLPSALCSLLTLFLIYDLAKRLWGPEEAIFAAGLLTFTLQFIVQAKSAQIDAMVSCWITMGCYGLLRFLLVDRQWRWYYLAFFFMGVGIITKGVGFLPVFLLPLHALFWFFSKDATRPNISFTETLRWLVGPIIMCGAIGLWLLPMLLAVDHSGMSALHEYRDNILFKQTVTRYADSWHHLKPFTYYLTNVIPALWLPLSLAIPFLIPCWYNAVKRKERAIAYPLFWIIIVVLFFSLSPGKRGVYILPALPMLALICAPFAKKLADNRYFVRLLWLIVMGISAVLALAGILGLIGIDFMAALENKYSVAPWLFLLFIGLAGIAVTLLTTRHNTRKAWPLFMCILWPLYSTWGYSLLNPVKTPESIYQNVQKVIGNQAATIALTGFSEQFILFSPYPVVHFGYHTPIQNQNAAAYNWMKAGEDARFILTDKRNVGRCFDNIKGQDVGYAHRTHWVLLSRSAMKPGCNVSAKGVTLYHYTPPQES